MPQNNDPLGILGSSTPEQAADPLGILSQTPPEKKSPIGTPSQGGLQGSQDTPPSASSDRKVPAMPLAGLGGVEPAPENQYSNMLEQVLDRGPKEDIGQYFVDGKPVSRSKMKQYLQDGSFIDSIAEGAGRDRVDIRGDQALTEFAQRQFQSRKTNDVYDSLMLSVARAGEMLGGAVDYADDLVSDITGVPNALYTIVGSVAGPSGATAGAAGVPKKVVTQAIEKFQEDAKVAESQRFQVEGDFIDQVGKAWETGKVEDIGNAVSTAINTAAESAVPSLLIGLGTAATGGGTGLLALARGGAVVTPLFIGGEYEQQKTQMKDIRERLNESQKFLSTSEVPTRDEIALINLSKAGQYIRPAVRGTAEMAGEIVSAGIWKGSAKLAAESLGSLVRKTATTVGKEAAEEVARTGSKELTKRMFESMAIDPLKEGFSELGTFAGQELTDVLLGVSTKSPDRILREGLNAWALGAASGGVMTSPGAAGTGIMLTGRGLTNAKKYLDNIIAFDPQGLNELNEVVRTMEERGQVQQAESIKENISKREKAVKAVPKEKVADTETVDTVEEIQALEESKKGLLPVYQEPIQEEINAKVEKLKSDVKKEYPAPTVNTTPTESNYASVNRNDGKETIDLTQEEYLAEMERRGTPVEEIAAEATPTYIVEQAKEVAPAEGDVIKSGPIQKQPLKPIPSDRDQFTSKLSDFSDVVYRETDSDGLLTLADPMRFGDVSGDYYFSNDPDIALGQGKNKGFIIEADASKLKGSLNTSKPGYEQVYNSGSAELIARYNDKKDFLESILSIIVKPDAFPKNRAEKMKFNSMVSGWAKIENADGSVTYRKPKPQQDAIQKPSTEEETMGDKPETREGVRGQDTQGQETTQEGETKEEVVSDSSALIASEQIIQPKPKTGISAETEVDDEIERLEKKAAERKALADRIRALKPPTDTLFVMPDFGITAKVYSAAVELIASQVEKGTTIGKAVQSAVAFIEEQLKGAPWNKKAFEESFQVFESAEPEPKPKKESPKREPAPKGTSEKRYATRTVNALSKLKDKNELEQAVRDLGLRQEVVSWKKVQPIAAEVVEDVFSDPKDVDAKANDFYNEVLGTTNKDYIDNPELSTLHALTFHMMLDRLSNEGLDALYAKYSSLFQNIGSGKGRFISAMQQDASPYALMNLKIRPIYEGMNEALNEISETGSTRFEEIAKVKELLDELLTKDELIEAYRKKVGILAQRLEEASVNQTLGETSVSKPSPKGKERVKAGRKLFFEGLKEARGQLSAGLPINEKMLNGVKEMIAGLIEEGIYEASRLKKAIMKDVNEQLKGQPDAIIDLAAAIDTYLQSKEFDESRKEAMKAAFIESIENRAKSLMGNKRATEKSAEQVLLDTLLQKVGQEIGKDAEKGSKAYEQRLKAALENLEFSDDVWKAAISNVRTWIGRQDMELTKKAEILARLEDSASLFMQNPFAKSDLRKAIRDGEKEIGVAVQDVVKQHWTSQNKLLESLAEKLVSELGLNAETAKKYEQAVMEEAKEYMNEKRLAAIREALSLDKNGMRKERSEKVNKRVIDKMIEAINLGILDDNAFRGFFAEKYGIVNLTPKDIRMMKNLNDLINIHEGTDISRRYTKELADYVETLKPWTATRVMMAAQGMTIKGMLTGLSTIAVNIPIGSIYSFTAATLPAIISNPVAFSAFMSEYSKAGLSKTGLKTFWDVLVDGYSPQEDGLGSKYDERDVYGDPIDYMIQNADKKKLWKDVRESKSPKEAAKNFGVMFAKGYLQIYRLANFAKAFDVLLSTRGVEFDLFLRYWNEESKAAGHPLRGKFDPNVSKDFIDKVREKMVYDPETRKEIEESVDKQIAGMRSRGERVGISYRQTLIREAMIAKRSMEDYKKAKERVASYLLMEQPTGLLSYAYDPLTKRMAIKEDNNPVSAALKLGFNLTLGLFLRISITAAQRGMENIPIAGLALPGILYDRVPSNPLDPRSEKEWRTFLNEKYDREQMKRRLMTHASVAVLAGIVAMNMFSLKDDEEEEEQEDGSFKIVKRTRIVENPDKIFDVTGFSGEFFKTEQFNEMNTPRKDYYFRMKVGDKWHNAVPLRLAPHFLFPVSVLGGMSDDLKFNPNKDRRKRELLIESADDFMLAWSEMSFATIPKTTKTLYFAFQKGGGEGLMKVGEIVVRPVRTAVYPNAYRDAYKETKFLIGAEEKLSQGMLAPLVNDFPFLEDYMGESTFDIFGYPKKVTSKLIQSAEDAPGAGMLVDSFLDYSAKNEERFESPAWQKKMKYFPNVEIPGYWPSGFDYETKVRAAQLYGELLRKQIEAIPESKLQASSIEETAKVIDIWMNGRIQYDGSRSGGGMHNKLTKEVRKEIGMDRLTAAQKEEFKLKTAVRSILDMPDNEQPQDINALLDKLAKATKERKTLEEELKPKKSNQ